LDNPFKTPSQLGGDLDRSAVVFSNDGTAIYFTGYNSSNNRENNTLSKLVLATSEVTQLLDFNSVTGIPTKVWALTIDSDGLLYWKQNDAVFQYNPVTGSNTLIAGALGVQGHVDSDIGTDARFRTGAESQPLRTDNLNNIYVSDFNNNAIRKIEHGTWKVSTVFQHTGPMAAMFFKDDFLYFLPLVGQIDIKAYSVVSDQVYDIYTDDSHLEAANSNRQVPSIYIDPYYNIYVWVRNIPDGTNGTSFIIPAADTAAAREAAYNAANP
jgi:hypothetical protein